MALKYNVSTDAEVTGTPSSSTYLRGDSTWSTPAGGNGGGADVKSGTQSVAHGSDTVITFGTAFTATPVVIATYGDEAQWITNKNHWGNIVIVARSTTQFTINQHNSGLSGMQIQWVATDAGNS